MAVFRIHTFKYNGASMQTDGSVNVEEGHINSEYVPSSDGVGDFARTRQSASQITVAITRREGITPSIWGGKQNATVEIVYDGGLTGVMNGAATTASSQSGDSYNVTFESVTEMEWG